MRAELLSNAIAFESQKHPMFRKIETYPLTQLAHNFDGWLSEKIGPKPKGGWSALANLGYPLDIVGKANGSPTSVGGIDDEEDDNKDDTPIPLTAATRSGVVGIPPEDPRADMFRGLFSGLETDEGLSMMDLIPILDNTGLEEHGMDWDEKFPIGGNAEIVGLESRNDLNGERAEIVSHIYRTLRIGVKVLSSGEELAIKPLNLLASKVGIVEQIRRDAISNNLK